MRISPHKDTPQVQRLLRTIIHDRRLGIKVFHKLEPVNNYIDVDYNFKPRNDTVALFDHTEYGEGWEAMAQHGNEMTQFERMILEDCFVKGGGGKVLRANGALPAGSSWLNAQGISRRLHIKASDAKDLVECWKTLEATPKMIARSFLPWIRQYMKLKGPELGLTYIKGYFSNLALEVAHAENVNPEDIMENRVPNQSPEEQLPLKDVQIFAELAEDERDDWLDNQPEHYRMLIEKLKEFESLADLKPFSQHVYNKLSKGLTAEQNNHFWAWHTAHKKRLTPKTVSSFTKVVIEFIKKQVDLTECGKKLHKIQKGILSPQKDLEPPAPHEWDIIWTAYKARKLELGKDIFDTQISTYGIG